MVKLTVEILEEGAVYDGVILGHIKYFIEGRNHNPIYNVNKSPISRNGADDMLSKKAILDELSKNLNTWREKYGVNRIGLFGSYNRDEQNESSDIDVVVEFNESDLSFDNYTGLKIDLEDHFQKQIDLVILNDIKPALKSNILSTITYVEEDN